MMPSQNENENNNINNTQDDIYSAIIYGTKPYVRVHSEYSERISQLLVADNCRPNSNLTFESACRLL